MTWTTETYPAWLERQVDRIVDITKGPPRDTRPNRVKEKTRIRDLALAIKRRKDASIVKWCEDLLGEIKK